MRSLPLAGQVYEIILDKILRFEMKPYQNCSEKQIAESLNVSRTPVREAFLRLSEQGFVDIYPQRGTVIAPLRLRDMTNSHFMREALEVALVRRAANLEDNSALVVALNREIRLQQTFEELLDEEAFYASDEKFHQLIAEHCELPEVWSEVRRVKLHFDRYRHLVISITDMNHVLVQHRKIVEMIEEKDPDGAEKIMRLHLARVYDLLKNIKSNYSSYFDDKE